MDERASAGRVTTAYIVLAAAVLAVYGQTAAFQYVNFDDDVYMTANTHVAAPISRENIRWAFTTGYFNNWHPLTWLSHMLDYRLFGMNPAGPHLENVLIHLANTLLLFAIFLRATGTLARSFVVAFLFAVHPLHVESVAWVSERKDVLSTFFEFAALWAYCGYVRRPSARRYAAIALPFALALMTKSMVVTFPCLLLLFDYWPLRRFETRTGLWERVLIVVEKAPIFALSLTAGIIAIFLRTSETVSLGPRILNTPVAYVKYFAKTVWPSGLAVYYPHPAASLSVMQAALAALFLVLVTMGVLAGRRRAPYLIAGWLWFLAGLALVIGIVQVSHHAMADRYTYVPIIGLFVMAVWGTADLWDRFRLPGWMLLGATACTLAALTVAGMLQTHYWRDSITLFSHAIQAVPVNKVANYNLGCALMAKNDNDEAAAQFRTALLIDPEYGDALSNLALALSNLGKNDEAVELYNKALALQQPSHPDYVNTLSNFALTLTALGKNDEALEVYNKALAQQPGHVDTLINYSTFLIGKGDLDAAVQILANATALDPGSSIAHYDLGLALAQLGKIDESTAEFLEALRLDPNYTDAHFNLGVTFASQGHFEQAIAEFSRVLRIDPQYIRARYRLADAHTNFAIALATHSGDFREITGQAAPAPPASANRLEEACQHLRQALVLKPDSLEALFNLANTLLRQGKCKEAAAQFTELVRVKPDDAEAHYGLGLALAGLGKNDEAAAQFTEALRINPAYTDAAKQLESLKKP